MVHPFSIFFQAPSPYGRCCPRVLMAALGFSWLPSGSHGCPRVDVGSTGAKIEKKKEKEKKKRHPSPHFFFFLTSAGGCSTFRGPFNGGRGMQHL